MQSIIQTSINFDNIIIEYDNVVDKTRLLICRAAALMHLQRNVDAEAASLQATVVDPS
jgi:hypothetical protein